MKRIVLALGVGLATLGLAGTASAGGRSCGWSQTRSYHVSRACYPRTVYRTYTRCAPAFAPAPVCTTVGYPAAPVYAAPACPAPVCSPPVVTFAPAFCR